MSKATLVKKDVTAAPCEKCGATDKFVQWRKEDREWLSCGRSERVNGEWKTCYGKPTGEEKPVNAPTPKPSNEQAAELVKEIGRYMKAVVTHVGVMGTFVEQLANELGVTINEA